MAEEEEAQQQEQLKHAYQAKLQQMQIEVKKKELLRRMLTQSAYERMSNVRLSNPDLYEKVVSSLAYVAQSGRRMVAIDDEQLRQLLVKMTERKETTIEFRKK